MHQITFNCFGEISWRKCDNRSRRWLPIRVQFLLDVIDNGLNISGINFFLINWKIQLKCMKLKVKKWLDTKIGVFAVVFVHFLALTEEN